MSSNLSSIIGNFFIFPLYWLPYLNITINPFLSKLLSPHIMGRTNMEYYSYYHTNFKGGEYESCYENYESPTLNFMISRNLKDHIVFLIRLSWVGVAWSGIRKDTNTLTNFLHSRIIIENLSSINLSSDVHNQILYMSFLFSIYDQEAAFFLKKPIFLTGYQSGPKFFFCLIWP